MIPAEFSEWPVAIAGKKFTTTIKEKLLIEAYRKASNYADDIQLDGSNVEFHKRLMEEYQLLDVLNEMSKTKTEFFSFEKPVKKAKEIALEAAVQLSGRLPTEVTFGDTDTRTPSPVVELAKEIYEWLTEPETDKR